MTTVGILQINPHTFWKRGGGEIHATKYLELLKNHGIQAERFNFNNPTKYDILHFFGANVQLAEWGKYAMKEGIKVVGTPILFPTNNTLKYKAFLKLDQYLPFPTTLRIRKEILCHTDHLIANTHAEKQYLSDAYGIAKSHISVLGTGVDQASFEADPKQEDLPEVIRQSGPYVLMVGRVTPLKGQLTVLRKLSETSIPLVLCGPPDLYEQGYIQEIREWVRKKPGQFFWIEGLPPDSAALKALYRFAQCHLLFSDTDVAPLVNMEAAAFGTLVVSKPHITVTEILGSYGRYVTETNLVSGLESVLGLKQSERTAEVSRLRAHVQSTFTWEKIVENTVHIYHSLDV
ncbi:MAG TPA: glycosyltransferase family 4 protein [Catalimonadaceae bacterium]|nr:glycosyltransferase family 4 protein [Catalimonadaceae bacterium]HPI10444.1 glycosyltransferase family 4 protein [Catalimonadaceae bacterium]